MTTTDRVYYKICLSEFCVAFPFTLRLVRETPIIKAYEETAVKIVINLITVLNSFNKVDLAENYPLLG